MSRPEDVSEVKDATHEVATFYLDEMVTKPPLMKAYTAFIEAAERYGPGGIRGDYGNTIKVRINKTPQQIADQLRDDQDAWDRRKKMYDQAMAGEEIDRWDRTTIKNWCQEEGLDVPDFVTTEA